jgi:hypothetical protein
VSQAACRQRCTPASRSCSPVPQPCPPLPGPFPSCSCLCIPPVLQGTAIATQANLGVPAFLHLCPKHLSSVPCMVAPITGVWAQRPTPVPPHAHRPVFTCLAIRRSAPGHLRGSPVSWPRGSQCTLTSSTFCPVLTLASPSCLHCPRIDHNSSAWPRPPPRTPFALPRGNTCLPQGTGQEKEAGRAEVRQR